MKTYRIISLILCLVLAFSCASCSCKVFSDPIGGVAQTTVTGETDTTIPVEVGKDWTIIEEPTCTKPGKAARLSAENQVITAEIPVTDHFLSHYYPEEKYLKEKANCEHADIYYVSCECGYTDNSTFESGYMARHEFENGTCKTCGKKFSEGLEFASNGDGTCYVKSIGSCKDSVLIIPEKSPAGDRVTAIGSNAFENNDKIETVFIPDGVTTIGERSFSRSGVLRVSFPETLRTIENEAFINCSRLGNVALPEGFETLGNAAFTLCIGIDSVTIPSTLKNIVLSSKYYSPFAESGSFTTCIDSVEHALNINCESSLTGGSKNKNSNVFVAGKLLAKIEIPADVTNLDFSFFSDLTQVEELTIPKTVTTLATGCFAYLSSLKKVIFEEGSTITELPKNAFLGCGDLETVKLPQNLKTIGESAFRKCSSLKTVTLPASVTAIYGNAFNNCLALESVSLPSGLESIGQSAFEYCESLKDITIPNTVTSIGKYAFSNCKTLEGIAIPDSVTTLGDGVFTFCSSLKNVSIGKGIMLIPQQCFNMCTSLEKIEIPENVKTIQDAAFSECASLYVVINKSSLNLIAGDLGNGYVAENAVEVVNDETAVTMEKIGHYIFVTKNGKKTLATHFGFDAIINLPELDCNYVIADDFMSTPDMTTRCVIIPSMVEEFGKDSFSGLLYLDEVVNESKCNINATALGKKNAKILTDKKDCHYSEKDGFTFYTEGDEVTLVAYFGDNTEVVFPDYAPDGKAYNIGHLNSQFTGPITDAEIGLALFKFTRNYVITSVYVPDTVKSIQTGAFYWMYELDYLRLPNINSNFNEAGASLIDSYFGCYSNGKWINMCGLMQATLCIGDVSELKAGTINASKSENSVCELVIEKGLKVIGTEAFLDLNLKTLHIPSELSSIDYSAFDADISTIYYDNTLDAWSKVTKTGEFMQSVDEVYLYANDGIIRLN